MQFDVGILGTKCRNSWDCFGQSWDRFSDHYWFMCVVLLLLLMMNNMLVVFKLCNYMHI